ncbi:MAG: hypothetical protein A3F84_26535 [Candidatus Handelsmanbacteria bacterium RIFCSPLOWO2_12_FULL_64_10]|uniref:Uncharacterized protein n=1 Tax=Handelsmanbacteria sp. (strain RIFCSPLOWO2_12_FULL_64_10) TaxID=1817868 RepID=A0A1F6CQI6_HANXR|nr:MAG: hypothetical protein A3F84_26535 [Candidatus Handelsmanbacteria bacterium RIFCSPLOWO2_12_FULL_64_10]
MTRRDPDRPEVVAGILPQPDRRVDELSRDREGEGPAVHVEDLVPDLHGLPFHGHAPLDERLVALHGGPEDHDIARIGVPKGGEAHVEQGDASAVDELVRQQEVPDQERVLHRAGGDAIGLHHRGPDEEETDKSD